MKRSAALLLACAAMSIAASAAARDTGDESPRNDRDRDRLGPLVPDFARLATGGWLGAANLALGYAVFDDVLNASVGYGFTPEREAGHRVHNLDVTLTVRPFELGIGDFRFVPVYVGGGGMYVVGNEYEVQYPYRYRRIVAHYYYPTALHWFALLGGEVGLHVDDPFFDRHAFFYQVVGLDTFITSYFDNDATLDVTDVLSSQIGYRASW